MILHREGIDTKRVRYLLVLIVCFIFCCLRPPAPSVYRKITTINNDPANTPLCHPKIIEVGRIEMGRPEQARWSSMASDAGGVLRWCEWRNVTRGCEAGEDSSLSGGRWSGYGI